MNINASESEQREIESAFSNALYEAHRMARLVGEDPAAIGDAQLLRRALHHYAKFLREMSDNHCCGDF